MLTRAISAPAHYGAPGILRYNADSLPPMHSAVKFAPLPQTEVFGRRAKFSSRLGVQGRSGILSKQRQHPDGINYDPNNVTKETTETTNQDDAQPEPNGQDATHGSTPHQASEKGNLHSPQPDSSLDLRRSASEDGTISTSSTKRGSSLKFWKKPSKRPTLPTIPSQAAIYVPDLPPPSPQVVKEPVPHDGASGVPPAPHVEIDTPPAPAGQNHELQVNNSDAANSSTTAVDVLANPPSTSLSSTPPTNTFTLDSYALSTPHAENSNPILNVVGETETEGIPEKTGVKPTDLSITTSKIESLEVSVDILDGKGTPPITAPLPAPV